MANVADGLRVTARRLPAKTAVTFGADRISYAELDAHVDRAAAALVKLGLAPGDRVALLMGNTPRFIEVVYGAWRAGLVVVPINAGFTAEEVEAILADAGARAVVADAAFAGTIGALRGALPAVDHVLVVGDPATGSGMTAWWSALEAAVDTTVPALADDPDALALLQYTSGTTGRAKGAMLRHAHLLANHDQARRSRLTLHEQDTVFCVLPLFHIYALNVAMGLSFAVGATLLLAERFDPLGSLHLIGRERASVVLGAPPMYIAWLNTPGAEDIDLSSVRLAVSGAAALTPKVLERAKRELGWDIWEGYGLTETAPALTSNVLRSEPLPGSVGRPLPDVELRIVDERGAVLDDGDVGEVVVRGPNVFAGYWQQPELTAEVLSADGWFATGDVGYLHNGDLYLVDRKRDLVIVSGFNVYPGEVEDALRRHPKIADAAVIAVPHPYTGEAVKAVVVLHRGEEATAEEIVAFAREHLARFKCPEVVEFADDLPRLPTGKVRRRLLRVEQPSVTE